MENSISKRAERLLKNLGLNDGCIYSVKKVTATKKRNAFFLYKDEKRLCSIRETELEGFLEGMLVGARFRKLI